MTTKERILKELVANEAISPNNLSLNTYVASVGGLLQTLCEKELML